jgi:hypothetical protein
MGMGVRSVTGSPLSMEAGISVTDSFIASVSCSVLLLTLLLQRRRAQRIIPALWEADVLDIIQRLSDL